MLFPDSTQKIRAKVAPILKVSPETSLAFGATVILNWDFKNANANTFSSIGRSTFIYTFNKQLDWTSYFEVYTKNNNFVFIGSISYKRFPQYYYGVGNEIEENDREKFDYQRFYVDLKGRYRVFNDFFVGVAIDFNTLYNVSWNEKENSKFWNNPSLLGTNGYVVSGLGPEISYDSRDIAGSPMRGSKINIAYLFYGEGIGSEYTYRGLEMRFSKYITISKKRKYVLALNYYGDLVWGDMPFDQIPGLGNDKVMRGYYNGRYRDKNYMAVQAEWRMPIWKVIGMTTWVGAGQVGNRVSDYTWSGMKPNFGIGLRVMIDKRSSTNLRIDEGFGRNTNGMYLSIGEAF